MSTPRCPKCNSTDVKVLKLPLKEDEEFIYCNSCKQITVITKVKIDEKED